MPVLCQSLTTLIICVTDNDTTPLPLRLVSGNNELEGRVEILYYGVWGTVCDGNFGMNSANVVCRRLGFPGALSVRIDFPWTTATVWLDNVQCIGNETGLEQCSHLGFGVYRRYSLFNQCDRNEDVGVVCIGMYICNYIINT